MYILKCFLDGELYKELSIEPGKEILVGRGAETDLKLDSYPGISREHIKIIHLGEKLLIERVSQSGKLIIEGQSERSVEIVDFLAFSIPPYNFEVQQEKAETSEEDEESEDEKTDPGADNQLQYNLDAYSSEDDDVAQGNLEKTSLSSQNLIGFIKRIEQDRITSETPLEGHKWRFGRAEANEFFVDNSKASRQHFEIFKLNDKFYVKDLGSSNGTYLNGHQLPANNEIELKTGDILSIGEYKAIFEIRNSEHELQLVNLPEVDTRAGKSLAHIDSPSDTGVGVKKVKGPKAGGIQTWDNQKKVRAALATLIVLGLLVYALMPLEQETNQASQAQRAAELRQQEEDRFIENAKIAALQYMDQANWSHCIAEVQRIQEVRPDDPDASEIALRCQTAMEQMERQNQIEAQERAREELLAKVDAIIEDCRDKVSEGSEVLTECLQPAIELNPENENIANLLDEAMQIDLAKEEELLKQEKYRKWLNSGRSVLRKADDFKDKQEWYDAIKWYNKYLNGKYPDPKKEDRPHAERELASIRSSLDSALQRALEEALAFYNQENYKKAVLAARDGLKVDEDHKELQRIERDSLDTLEAEVRSLYQDSIIMEDLGKIHTAISKWKQIVEKDVPGEDYHNKATSKLKIYETEI